MERLTSIITSKDCFNITNTPQPNIQTYTSQENLNIPFCKLCHEKFYAQTTRRNEGGRYIVRLPFKTEFLEKAFLGSSRFVALVQYSRMEKTLSKDSTLQSQFHTPEATSSYEIVSQGKYNSFYLPHHAVVRPEHKTTKVRVVFNDSRMS